MLAVELQAGLTDWILVNNPVTRPQTGPPHMPLRTGSGSNHISFFCLLPIAQVLLPVYIFSTCSFPQPKSVHKISSIRVVGTLTSYGSLNISWYMIGQRHKV